MNRFLLIFILLVSGVVSAQNTGVVSGKLTDKEFNNEPLAFANVLIQGTTKGTTSDFDGNYNIDELEPGNYVVLFSFVGYKTIAIETLIIAGKTNEINIVLEANSAALEEIVIKTTKKRETESALLLQQKKAVLMETAIGAQELSKKGVGDIAGAVTKIAGISKQSGSGNVFVRGLGDRYNITTLNGLPLASNNAAQKNIDLSLFSTDIVENIGVSKTFNAQNYGDFGGANINIDSKNFTRQPYLAVNFSFGGNTNALETNDFYLQDGPSRSGFHSANPPSSPATTSNWGSSWNRKTSDLKYNGGLSVNGGRSFELGEEGRLNAFFTAGFDNSSTFNSGLNRGKIGADGYTRQDFNKDSYSYTTNTTAMGVLNYRMNSNHKLSFTSLFLNSSDQNHDEYNGFDIEFDNDATANENGVGFIQRNTFTETKLLINQLSGTHAISDTNTVHWIVGYNGLNNTIPDRMQNTAGADFRADRTTDFVLITGSPIYNHRFFQDLKEEEFSVNISNKIKFNDSEDDLKGALTFGYSGRFKMIDFSSQQYDFRLINQAGLYNVDITNFDAFFNASNLNTLYRVNTLKTQTYSGGQYINAGYVNGLWNFSSKFSVVAGVRAEMIGVEIDYLTLQSSNKQRIGLVQEKLLPSLSTKYVLKENMNLKFGASKTYTLPQFKERVDMLYEEVTQVYRGNKDIYESTNWNADLKWEYFPSKGELISATVFGKLIQNPINSIFINSTSNDISYINSGDRAEVFGLEVELKKELYNFNGNDAEFEHKLSGGLNVSLIQTTQDLNADKVNSETEYSASFTFDSSQLTGASEVLVNTDVTYFKAFDNDHSLQATVAYNYFSDQLNTIGTLKKGNVIDKSFNTLDLIVKSKLNKLNISLSAKNLLNPSIKRVQEVYETPGISEVTLSEFKRGINISLSVGYRF
ncbi:TonB-dependent receptor [Flavobacteriaceae bacterium]|nr:TonB-dependent receptor [Flavobacteriaceae bacterium]